MKTISRIRFVLGILLLISSLYSFSQVSINTDNSPPNNSAMLDVKSTNKGLLIPRLSQNQIEAISTPANGLIVFCTTDNKVYIYIANTLMWKELLYGTGTILTCGNSITDSRDGKTYNTVQIGTQCWFKENLNIGTRIDGSDEQTNNSTMEKYCYDDLESNCNVYGGLYKWNEAMQYSTTPGVQGICPTGWHFPTDTEWTTLTDYVNSQPSYKCNSTSGWIAKAMAATTLWQSSNYTCAVGNNLSLNNATGFSGLPGGSRYDDGYFDNVGYYGYWWTSTEIDNDLAWSLYLSYGSPAVGRYFNIKDFGFSIRCLRDN